MADYISREALAAHFRRLANEARAQFEEFGDEAGTIADTFFDAAADVKNFPAADVESVGQWIRADEREPEADEFVLAIVSGEPTPYEVLENGYVLAMVTDEGWMLPEWPEWPEWRDAEVHYWMPLPEPPKVGMDGKISRE